MYPKEKTRKKRFLREVPPRFELGSLDSKSRVLTITPWDRRLREKLHRQIQNKAHAMATKNYPVVFQFHTSSSLIVDGVTFVTREIIFTLLVFTCWLTVMLMVTFASLHRKKVHNSALRNRRRQGHLKGAKLSTLSCQIETPGFFLGQVFSRPPSGNTDDF